MAKPDRNLGRTLVHIGSGRAIATLRTSRRCKALASELAPVWVRDPETVAGVVKRHEREALYQVRGRLPSRAGPCYPLPMPTRPKRSRDPVQAAHQVYREIAQEAAQKRWAKPSP